MRKINYRIVSGSWRALAMPADADGMYIGAGPVGVGVGVDTEQHDAAAITTPETAMRW